MSSFAKFIAFLAWTVFVAIVGIVVFGLLTRNLDVPVGQEFNWGKDRALILEGQGSAEIGASGPFTLRQEDDVVLSHKDVPPIGWPSGEFYGANPEEFSGRWEIVQGPTLSTRLHGQTAAHTQVIDSAIRWYIVGIAIACLVIWVIGILMSLPSSGSSG